ncbi:MAG TPA: hypothetical protein P5110_07615 [Candidatus Omnitrophota bacterium]|nr:hypothetical protein [Candidatus Omnitrophota bacterium]
MPGKKVTTDDELEQGGAEGAEDLLNEEIDSLGSDAPPEDDKGAGKDEGQDDGEGEDKGGAADDGTSDDPLDQKHSIKWNGEDREFPLRDILRFAQMGFDYNHKNQELKRQKLDLDTRQQEFVQGTQFLQWWKENPQAGIKLKELIESGDLTVKEAEKIIDKDDPVLQKLTSLEQRIAAKEAKEDDAALDGELKGLQKDLKAKGIEHNWDTPGDDGRTFEEVLLDYALENGFATLRAAYRDLMFDNAVANTRERTEKEVLARLKKNKEVPDTDAPAKKRAVIRQQVDIKGKSYDDLGREVLDEIAQGVYG